MELLGVPSAAAPSSSAAGALPTFPSLNPPEICDVRKTIGRTFFIVAEYCAASKALTPAETAIAGAAVRVKNFAVLLERDVSGIATS